MSEEQFWENQASSTNVLRKRSKLQNHLELLKNLRRKQEEAEVYLELLDEGAATEDDATSVIEELTQFATGVESRLMLQGEMDQRNAIVSINPGAGGTESQDWALMLFEMYKKWVSKQKYELRLIDQQMGEQAGIKGVTFMVEGPCAYGYLRAEIGVHRLVRISPFDASGRRHTSFASVAVSPELDDEIEIELDEKDLKIETFRASGAGGQHVNVTDSAVRIRHEPSGITVQCQQERSQHRNKAIALRVLKSRLYEYEKRKQREAIEKSTAPKKRIEWGSQIRSYVLHPYKKVKDHRTDLEVGNAEGVLNGDIQPFIEQYLLMKSDAMKAAEVE